MVAIKSNNLIVCGLHELWLDLDQQRVGSVRQSLTDVLNVGRWDLAYVQGRIVSDDFQLRSGDILLFIRSWGKKRGKERSDGDRYVPAGAPDWVNETLIGQTLDTWQPYYERRLTCEDALEIVMNISRYWEVVKEWQKL